MNLTVYDLYLSKTIFLNCGMVEEICSIQNISIYFIIWINLQYHSWETILSVFDIILVIKINLFFQNKTKQEYFLLLLFNMLFAKMNKAF